MTSDPETVLPSASEINRTLSTTGYVILPSLFPASLLSRLLDAAEEATTLARTTWPHIRLVGKQFPPWPASDRRDAWGIQHILHPDLGPPASVFAEYYAAPLLLEACCRILGCEVKDLQMELCNMLIEPAERDFGLDWHRDSIRSDLPLEEEEAAIKEHSEKRPEGVQWNTALVDDECFILVPGTHRRKKTEGDSELTLKLKKGETVFYDNNVLHRAQYKVGVRRRTLHACVGLGGSERRATNILQHGMDWVKDTKFEDEALEGMRKRLVDWGERVPEGAKRGYSLVG